MSERLQDDLQGVPLGQATCYSSHYDASLLFPLSRQPKRDEIGVEGDKLPFTGIDIWTAYEVSWLNAKGKPVVAIAEFTFPAESPRIIESKSFKLYLNSFNGTRFESAQHVTDTLQRDLTEAAGALVIVKLMDLSVEESLQAMTDAQLLDDLDITVDNFRLDPSTLSAAGEEVSEVLYSNLLKSNCLVTGQPDWGTVVISYTGPAIDHEGLLRYIISFRDHMEFHEQCVERIFVDVLKHCHPRKLTVYARYLRRGGLDINPYRSTEKVEYPRQRLIRQ